MTYYLLQNDETKGPYTLGQLRSMWHAGNITGETQYCETDGQVWKRLAVIAAEMDQLPRRPPLSVRFTGHRILIGIMGVILAGIAVWAFRPLGWDYATVEYDKDDFGENGAIVTLRAISDDAASALCNVPWGARVRVLAIKLVPGKFGAGALAQVKTKDGTIGWMSIAYLKEQDAQRLMDKYKPWTKP